MWPLFCNQQDAEEVSFYTATLHQLLHQWSQSVVSVEIVTVKDHSVDLTMPQMPQLTRFAMSNITSKTMLSLMKSAEQVREIVYLRSDFNSDKLSNNWSVVEKASDGSGTPYARFLETLLQHHNEWERQYIKQSESG